MAGDLTSDIRYADYDLTTVDTLVESMRTTGTRVDTAAGDIKDHWGSLPQFMSGSGMHLASYYSGMNSRVTDLTSLADTLAKARKSLENYRDRAKGPIDNLARLRDEVIAWQADRPNYVTVASTPGSPVSQQDIWAREAGYQPGTVCLSESPWTTWYRRERELEAEIHQYQREYEKAAQDCQEELRGIRLPLWAGAGGSAPGLSSGGIFRAEDRLGQTWRGTDRFGYDDGRRVFVDGTWDGRTYEDQRGDGTDAPRKGVDFSYGVEGYNVGADWQYAADGTAQTSYGDPDGVHGDLAASYTAGIWADSRAGVNFKDGNFEASASAEVSAGVKGDASASVEYGIVQAGVSAEAFAGATAGVAGTISAGKDGVKAKVGGEAFAGAQASASADFGVSGVKGTAGVTGYAGIGVKAEIDADIGWDSVKMDVDVGAALGLGGAVKFSIDVSPKEIVSDMGDFADDVGDFFGGLF